MKKTSRGAFEPPRIKGILTNPYYYIRKGLYDSLKSLSPQLGGKLLDVGCGAKPYQHLFSVDQYIGLDIETSGHNHADEQIDIFYDGKTLPFEDDSFDSILLTEVLEHVFNPNSFLLEINRVLKKDGRILITLPFLMGEHEEPFDYARYTSFGIKDLLQTNGFAILEQRKSTPGILALAQMINLYFLNKLYRFQKNKTSSIIIALVFYAPVNIIGYILHKILPSDSKIYCNNVILAENIKA